MMHVKGFRVLVRPRPEPEQDADVLIQRPEAYVRHQVTMGKVLSLGEAPACKHCGKGKRFEVEPGDVVLFAPTAGEFVYDDDGERLLILPHDEISAVVDRMNQEQPI